MLRLVERSFESPSENLAFDEALLESGFETLRLWESPLYFVVLGRSGKPEVEVNVEACARAGIPVLRRSSGGGAVLLGPGCLGYSLILSLAERPELATVETSYRIILGWIARALSVRGLEVHGSDLLLNGRKAGGSAQRRTRGWLLHHGTLLYGMDLNLLERCLHEPQRQPPHRNGRTHSQFLAMLPDTARVLAARLASNLPALLSPAQWALARASHNGL